MRYFTLVKKLIESQLVEELQEKCPPAYKLA